MLKILFPAVLTLTVIAAAPAAAQSTDRICAETEARAMRLNQMKSPQNVVQMVRSIYTDRGLAFGGEPTTRKCLDAIADMVVLEAELRGEPASRPAPACVAAQILQDDIVRQMENLGMFESGALDAIYSDAGMRIADLNPDGRDTTLTCGKALGPLTDYLATLRSGGADTAPDSFDLPAAYGVTHVQTVNPAGTWTLNRGSAMTLWNHNGSEMAWEVGPGNDRVVYYWQPRAGLGAVGVSRGTLLFEGARDGDNMRGDARIFTRSCGVWTYPVSGPIGADNASVTLYGQRPVVDDACVVTAVADDVLRFNYVADAPAGEDFQAFSESDPEMMDTPAIGLYVMPFRVINVPANDTLNVRAGPSTANRVLFELPPNASDMWMIGEGCTPYVDQYAFSIGSYAERLALIEGKWCNVKWQGRTGWVFGGYIAPM